LVEFVEYLDATREKLIEKPIYLDTDKTGMPIEVAMQYNTSYGENVHSYVNNINTHEGGTHLAGFRRALTRTLKTYADKSGMLEKKKFEISGEDFREGLTAVVSVKVAEPQFEGQTKTKLGNNEVIGAVDTAVGEVLQNYLEENPKEAKVSLKKCSLQQKPAMQPAKHASKYNAKTYLVEQDSPENFPTALIATPEM
jgi:DNA gyrase subunit B